MEILYATEALWRNRIVAALGVVLAIAVGLLFASRPAPVDNSAVAWTRVALDTPQSQLVEAAPDAVETLPWRAQMLADLMGSEQFRRQLAAGMGVPLTQVDVVNTTLVDPPIAASLPEAASKSSKLVTAPFVVQPAVPNVEIPLIVLSGSAPNAVAAKKLVSAAVKVLEGQSTQPGRYESSIINGEGNSQFEPFEVQQVAQIQTRPLAEPPSRVIPIAVAVVILSCWWAGIVFVLAPLKRRLVRRRARLLLAQATS